MNEHVGSLGSIPIRGNGRSRLLSRIQEAEHLNALQGLLFEVFQADFGEENCGDRERYEAAASEIWKAYERHRAI